MIADSPNCSYPPQYSVHHLVSSQGLWLSLKCGRHVFAVWGESEPMVFGGGVIHIQAQAASQYLSLLWCSFLSCSFGFADHN